MPTYDTSARRGVLTKKITDRVADVIIDIEEALEDLPHSGKSSLLDKLEGVLAGVAADPAGVASGRVSLALGAGPAPAPTTPPIIDPTQAISDYAATQGFDLAQFTLLLGAIDARDPHTVDDAINAALGLMVSRTDFTNAENQRNALATRLAEVETSMGMPRGSLTGARGLPEFNAAKAALAGTPPLAGTPTAAEIALNGALGGLTRDRRHPERVRGDLDQAIVTAWADERGL